ncbi:tyrosine--tRNA ligase [Antribacter sp. KLBMP9083]|uniref:Tyrosine--tRNA ligase n=1 Tax=Antribacter soli TaxID=2910976 RepID=A0AA41QFU2_9MICO|nr:tyrosine--tRNA ligase [Antribacter soli]MCF4122015.1 tyrosine--tRNA ligase [Antribacter soli]
MTRLAQSVQTVTTLLRGADLAGYQAVSDLLTETTARRTLDLSDLSPTEQAELIGARTQQLQPSAAALAERVARAAAENRPFIAKFGIDPTGSEVHLGHAVPMMLLSRVQRMGHQVVFIVGDVTAKIGDPSGRSDERPALSDEDIARNLATYKDQVTPFFDFSRGARFRHNGDWLREITLPRMIEILAKIPVSMPLQREDFRKRLEAGQGLSMAELIYSVVMALDSVEIGCDLEIGGIDQFLNMQMGRKVMEISGQAPEIVVATSLIEGTDGTGAKMSKSQGNYVPVAAPAGEVFGKLMSVPDRLVEPYFRALSEWTDPELAVVTERLAAGTLHPMDLKKILAGEVTAAIHELDAAMKARQEFTAQFSKRSFSDVSDLPVVADLGVPVTEVVKALGFATSNGDVRRVAEQHGLRIVVESEAGQEQTTLTPDDARQTLTAVLAGIGTTTGEVFLKVGRRVARIEHRR